MIFQLPVRTFRKWLGRQSQTQSPARRARQRQTLWVETLESRELWSVSFPLPEFVNSDPNALVSVSIPAPVSQAVVSASPPYSDSFTRANSNNLGADWTAVAGGFDISSNVAYGQSATNIASVNTLTADNVAVQADVALAAGQSVGVMARYGGSGQQNFYLGHLINSNGVLTASIYRNVNGAYTQLSAQTVNTGTGTLRFELSGTSLKLFLNSTLVTFANDSTFTSGKIGIYSTANVSVDNFSATSITPLPQPLPFTDNFDTAVSQQLSSTAWTNQAGVFNVQTGVASASAAGGVFSLATVNGVSAANVTVSASVTVTTPGQYAGVVARYSGPGSSNFYLAALNNTGAGVQASIFRNSGGNYVLLGQAAVAPTSSGQLRFEVSGSSLKLFFNGTLLTSTNDTALTTGSVGIFGSAGSIVDAFNASALVTTPPVLPFTDSFTTVVNQQLNSTAWTNQAGVFTVNGVNATGQGALSLAALNGISAADVAVQADVSGLNSPGQLAGLIARYSGPGDANYYLATLVKTGAGAEAHLWRNVGGAYVQLAAVVAPASSGLLRFEVSGASLKLYLNGNLLTSANDSALTTGSVGMRSTAGATYDNFNAAILPPAPTTSLPFTDNFTTAVNSQLSTVWTNQVGVFTVSGGLATGPGANSLATLNGVSAANVGVEANVAVTTAGQYGGLVARYSGTGDSNYYLAILNNTGGGVQANIYRNLNGAYTLLDSRAVGSASGLLRFETSGSSLKVFLNGTIVAHANDTQLTIGSVGMRSTGGTTFDNFNATAINLTPQAVPFTDAFDIPTTVNGQLNNNAWINQAGTAGIFDVSGGKATGLGALSIASLNGLSAANVAVQADVTVAAAGQYAGLIARYGGTGDSNYYLATLYNTGSGIQASIYRNLGGSYALLGQAVVAPASSGTLRFELSGTSLKLFLNGNLLTSANDSTLTTGSVGMRSGGAATFDNFNVLSLFTPPQSVPFTDNFNTATSAQLNSIAWTNQAGIFTVSGGLATGPTGTGLATVNGLSVANVVVQAAVAVQATNRSAGLVARYVGIGEQNFYLAELFDDGSVVNARIWRNVNGVFTLLASGVATTDTGLLRFEVTGTSLSLFLNNTLLASATDSALTTGSVGMRATNGGTFDNFTVN